MNRAITLLALTALLAGCDGRRPEEANAPQPSTAPPAKSTLTPEQLGALGAAIRKEPGRGDELLAEHGLTRATFEQAIRDVTENADASRRYAAAYRKAGA
ncbi:MAG TPA: hypothetical protein VF911_21565 [Thermoanaerobaculia bacterium]|jgi:hypothetical protein